MSASELFKFATIPLGDFESCYAFVETHRFVDFKACAEIFLRQTYRTFEKMMKKDYEDRHHHLIQNFAMQNVQQYALLSYGAECGSRNLMRYLHELVLTPEMYRTEYVKRMSNVSPQARLEFLRRPVPGHLERLRLFCILYDYLYGKIEKEVKYRLEQTLIDKVHSRIEYVQAHLVRKVNSQGTIGKAV